MSNDLSAVVAPVLLSTRRHLGTSFAAARQLARLSRADLARALGCEEHALANLESGSLPLERGP